MWITKKSGAKCLSIPTYCEGQGKQELTEQTLVLFKLLEAESFVEDTYEDGDEVSERDNDNEFGDKLRSESNIEFWKGE